jgi:signal peptidase I
MENYKNNIIEANENWGNLMEAPAPTESEAPVTASESPVTESPHPVTASDTPVTASSLPVIASEAKQSSAKPPLFSRNVLLWARDIAIALVIALILMQFIKPTIVREHSMEQTLHPNDYIFLSKQAYTFGDVRHGDIIVFKSHLENTDGTDKNLIKRAIGLPGDTIEIKGGYVYRNGEQLDEPYINEGTTEGEYPLTTVPDGELFVLGDNRQHSTDSRSPSVGFVPEDTLIGKAIFRLYPFDGFGTLG